MTERLSDLERLRDLLWESLSDATADKRAPLAAQYRATLSELEALSKDVGKAGDPLDEIAARRSARGVATAGKGRSAV